MQQPLHERGAVEEVAAVMKVVVNWRGARSLNVLHRNGGERGIHLPITGNRRGDVEVTVSKERTQYDREGRDVRQQDEV